MRVRRPYLWSRLLDDHDKLSWIRPDKGASHLRMMILDPFHKHLSQTGYTRNRNLGAPPTQLKAFRDGIGRRRQITDGRTDGISGT